MEKQKEEKITRGLALDVFLENNDQYHAVKNSIAHYRHVARSVFGCVFAAQAAGATTDIKDEYFRVIPNNERSKAILALVFDKAGKAPVYEARQYVLEHLAPTWMSFVWDSLRASVWSRWQARDPELNAQRGYLALNGVRRLAMCNNVGIEFPTATARPKLDAHAIILKWDRDIGPVTIKIPKLDPGRWRVWQRIVTGEIPHGTLTLNERDGKFRLSLSYELAAKSGDLNPEAVLEVRFAPEKESAIRVVHGNALDSMSAVAAVSALHRIKQQASRYDREKAAAGSSNRRWGNKRIFRAQQQRVGKCTVHRDRVVQNWNHLWTRRVIDNALRWKCGKIDVGKLPENMFEFPWQWADFEKMLKYKAGEYGIVVVTK